MDLAKTLKKQWFFYVFKGFEDMRQQENYKKTIRISKNQLRGLKLLCKLDWKASGQAILEPRGP